MGSDISGEIANKLFGYFIKGLRKTAEIGSKAAYAAYVRSREREENTDDESMREDFDAIVKAARRGDKSAQDFLDSLQ